MLVSPYHVTRGKQRKIVVVRTVGKRVIIQRANAAVATAWHVNTDNKILCGVKKSIATHKAGPPFNRVAVCGKRMKYPHNVAFIFIQLAMCGICQMKAMQSFAAF